MILQLQKRILLLITALSLCGCYLVLVPSLFHLCWHTAEKENQQGTFEMSGGFLGISPPNFFLIASSCPQKHYYVQYNLSCRLLEAIRMVIPSPKE